MKNKGFAHIILLVGLVIIAILFLGSYLILGTFNPKTAIATLKDAIVTLTSKPNQKDSLKSYNNFKVDPTADWKTYNGGDFTIDYSTSEQFSGKKSFERKDSDPLNLKSEILDYQKFKITITRAPTQVVSTEHLLDGLEVGFPIEKLGDSPYEAVHYFPDYGIGYPESFQLVYKGVSWGINIQLQDSYRVKLNSTLDDNSDSALLQETYNEEYKILSSFKIK